MSRPTTMMNTSGGGLGDNGSNAILHASLLSGTLSVKVIDVDIRRDASTRMRIETDYILQVDIGAEVSVHRKTKLCEKFQRVQEVDEYFCSKRYADVRDLARAIGGHAEDVVRYYHHRRRAGGASSSSKWRGGGYLHVAMRKASQAVHSIAGAAQSPSSLMRASEALDPDSPSFVRVALSGVDDFCSEVHSAERHRTRREKCGGGWANVKGTAERRRAAINRAFSLLIQALSSADISSAVSDDEDALPVPMRALIRSLEEFLLTDVLVDLETEEEDGVRPRDAAAKSSSSAAPDRRPSAADAAPCPRTMRRRASYADRMAEERSCREVVHILLSEGVDTNDAGEANDVGGMEGAAYATLMENGRTEAPTTEAEETRLLPRRPADFGIIFALGVVFFKAIEGRVLNVSMDSLVVFGLMCALSGRRWAVMRIRGDVDVSASHRPTPREREEEGGEEEKTSTTTPEPSRPRPAMHRISGSLNLSTQRVHRLSLLQKSLRHLGASKDDAEVASIVVPARTFHKFPEGAAIGSHHNCWSSPPSENFQVRGPNYLRDKAKVASADYIFPCRGCDLFLTDNAPINVGRNRSILGGKLRDVPTFIINYRLPWGIFLSYHEIPERFLPFLRRGNGHGDLKVPLPSLAGMPAGDRAMCNFLLSDTDAKNRAWKLIPVVVDGPWMVKRVVGGKPAIVGTKLPISYVYQPPENGRAEYLEADLDIVSSAAARNVLAVVRSYTQVLTIDLGYVVQGDTSEELPEQMMLGLRLHGLDPLTAELLPDFENISTFPQFEDDSGNETD